MPSWLTTFILSGSSGLLKVSLLWKFLRFTRAVNYVLTNLHPKSKVGLSCWLAFVVPEHAELLGKLCSFRWGLPGWHRWGPRSPWSGRTGGRCQPRPGAGAPAPPSPQPWTGGLEPGTGCAPPRRWTGRPSTARTTPSRWPGRDDRLKDFTAL